MKEASVLIEKELQSRIIETFCIDAGHPDTKSRRKLSHKKKTKENEVIEELLTAA